MVMNAQILKFMDDHGRTVDRSALGDEIAMPTVSGVRRVIGEAVASGLSPERLVGILRQSSIGDARAYLTLAEEMEERYLHYASQLQTRRLALEGIPVTIEHDDKVPSKIVDAVNDLVEGSDFTEMTGTLGDGIAKGYAVSEMSWEFRDRLLKPVRYRWRDPRFFVYDDLTGSELRLAVDGLRDGERLPAGKFIIHEPRSRMGLPIRRGMARPAAWAFLIQSFALKDWAAFAEIYGVPLRVGKYHAAASAADKRTLLQAVRSIANDAAAIVPAGMEIIFEKLDGQHGAAVFGGLIEYVDKQVSKLVLGQTMTSDDGASMAQAVVHNGVRMDICRADGGQLGQTISRDLIVPFVDFNFGPQEVYPRAEFKVSEPEDMKALTNAVQILVPLGLRVSAREVRERTGFSEPEKGEEILMAPAKAAEPETGQKPGGKPAPANDPKAKEKAPIAASAPAGHVAGCQCGGCLALLAAPADDGVGEVEQLADDVLSQWEEIVDPILKPIREILATARSYDEALQMLEAAGPDTTAFRETLARATSIARGIGDIRD